MPGQPAWMIWAVSFGVWMFVTLADAGSIYELYRSTGGFMSFPNILGMQCSQVLTYFPLTPFVFALATRYPIQRGNWLQRSLLHLAGGLVFTVAHITLRGLTPYGFWDSQAHAWSSAIWDSQVHVFRIRWPVFGQLFLRNFVDDITGTYVAIVLVAHAVAYYRHFRERQLRASQLEAHLAKARRSKGTTEGKVKTRCALMVCFLLLSVVVAQTQHTAQDQILQVTGDWLQGISQGDRVALNKIMDPHFIATTPTGDVLTKDRLVPDDETRSVQKLPLMKLDGPMVRLYRDTAVLMGRLKPAGEGQMNGTFVYMKQDNSWKLVALHLSTQK
jgi:hypothetical protein